MILRRVLQVISWVALVGLVLPAVLFLAGSMELEGAKTYMLVATLAWFIVTPFWMGRGKQGEGQAEAG